MRLVALTLSVFLLAAHDGGAAAPASGSSGMPALAPLPAGSQPIAPQAGLTTFTFIFAGDNRPASATCAQPPQLNDVVNGIKSAKPAFALWGGDIIYGKDTKTAAGQYPAFITAVQAAGVPIFVAPGNHEMSVKGTVDCPVPGKKHKEKKIDEPDRSPTHKLATAYSAAIGAPYGIFYYGNSAFIAVNTDDALDSEYDPGDCGYNGYVGKMQVDALKATLDSLKGNTNVAHIFIFMHRPLHGEKSDDEVGPSSVKEIARFQSLLEPGSGTWPYPKVSFIFSSHEHLFYFYDPKGTVGQKGPFTRTDPSTAGPSYILSGGAGAPLSGSGYFHYLTVTVNGATVTATIVPINDSSSNCSK
jgi:hypothetical protein